MDIVLSVDCVETSDPGFFFFFFFFFIVPLYISELLDSVVTERASS